MDFGLAWEQKELQRTARDFLDRSYPPEKLRDAEASDAGFDLAIYRRMGEMGWFGLALPGSDDGEEFINLILLHEEYGRAALPGPHFVSGYLCAQLLGSVGGQTHKAVYDAVTEGRQIATAALYEESASYDAASVALAADDRDDRITLNGSKLFVPYAHVAEQMLVLARTGAAADDLTFYVVPKGIAGVALVPMPTISGEKQFAVTFDSVSLDAGARLGPRGGGWRALAALLPAATVVQAALLAGHADAAYEIALDYAKTRIAFGKPIGAFQAVQHLCADMVTDRDAVRFVTYQAACLVAAGQSERAEVAMAKAFAVGAARRVTKIAHQILAGLGYVLEFPLNHHYRRVKTIELLLGDVNEQLDTVASRMGLGAP